MKILEAFATFLGVVAASLFVSLISSAAVYFALDVANSIDGRVPTLPFWALRWVVFAIRLIIPHDNGSSEE